MCSNRYRLSPHGYFKWSSLRPKERQKGLDNRRNEVSVQGRRRDMSKLVITILSITGEIAVVAAGFILYLMYS